MWTHNDLKTEFYYTFAENLPEDCKRIAALYHKSVSSDPEIRCGLRLENTPAIFTELAELPPFERDVEKINVLMKRYVLNGI